MCLLPAPGFARIPIPSAADFRNQLKVAVKKDKAHVNKIKSTIKAETKNTKLTDEEVIINEWTTPTNYIIPQQYDSKAYENIEKTIIKENKLNHHIFTPSLLAFTKKFNDKIIKKYSIFKDYKDKLYSVPLVFRTPKFGLKEAISIIDFKNKFSENKNNELVKGPEEKTTLSDIEKLQAATTKDELDDIVKDIKNKKSLKKSNE